MNLPPLPEPDMCHEKARDDCTEEFSYSPESVREYGESCARMAREEAAKECDNVAWSWDEQRPFARVAHDCAAAIRKG